MCVDKLYRKETSARDYIEHDNSHSIFTVYRFFKYLFNVFKILFF